MCDTENLIDLSEFDEPQKDHTTVEEKENDNVVTNCFKEPYDPFDFVENEAYNKANFLKCQIDKKVASAECQYPDLVNESPPVCMQSDGLPAEATRQRCTNNSFQKQLLKLNASRSIAHMLPHCDDTSQFERTILKENLQMLAAESPLKLIEDDALSSSANFEEDLKMMRIPILDVLRQEETTSIAIEKHDNQLCEKSEAYSPLANDQSKSRHLGQLLQQLKVLTHEHIDKSKWHYFDVIIDSIFQNIFGGTNAHFEANEVDQSTKSTLPLPYAYTRQGTFDLEPQYKKERSNENADNQEISLKSTQGFPEAIVSSTATFDGESYFEKQSLPFAPLREKDSFMTELVDESLALQINKILEHHSLTKTAIGINAQHSTDPRTVILLVNPQKNDGQPSICDKPLNSTPQAMLKDAGTMRRRSSSLSIHDKTNLIKDSRKSDRQLENLENVQPRDIKNTTATASLNAATAFRQRRNSFSTTINTVSKPCDSRRTIIGNRIKTPSISESLVKSQGVMKPTIPIKRVVPIMKPLSACNESKNLTISATRCSIPETPMSSKGKAGQKIFSTSTPLPQMRSQARRSHKPPL
ncbi:uncharacterized protein Dana_GF19621 [Drosophila ananassae]|uniref:Uncharacterized protein n=1 Tax=Drosophila ananassae TaxID=7217 RepID=B3N0T4_DROAN|nr:uncharacterized protein LOC6502373 [Drosophila ananassae]EDV34813.1 uncharacterized protein Dana_GF19621 [Drosophila ananassae]